MRERLSQRFQKNFLWKLCSLIVGIAGRILDLYAGMQKPREERVKAVREVGSV